MATDMRGKHMAHGPMDGCVTTGRTKHRASRRRPHTCEKAVSYMVAADKPWAGSRVWGFVCTSPTFTSREGGWHIAIIWVDITPCRRAPCWIAKWVEFGVALMSAVATAVAVRRRSCVVGSTLVKAICGIGQAELAPRETARHNQSCGCAACIARPLTRGWDA